MELVHRIIEKSVSVFVKICNYNDYGKIQLNTSTIFQRGRKYKHEF